MYLDRLCACGEDVELCRHPFNDGAYEVKIDTCQKQAAIERYRADRKEPLEPGAFLYAVYTRDPDEELIPIHELGQRMFVESDDD